MSSQILILKQNAYKKYVRYLHLIQGTKHRVVVEVVRKGGFGAIFPNYFQTTSKLLKPILHPVPTNHNQFQPVPTSSNQPHRQKEYQDIFEEYQDICLSILNCPSIGFKIQFFKTNTIVEGESTRVDQKEERLDHIREYLYPQKIKI